LSKAPNPAKREVHIIMYAKTKESGMDSYTLLFSIMHNSPIKRKNTEIF